MSDIVKMPREQIDQICKTAIEDAKRFGLELDGFTEENVAELEVLLGKLNEHILKGGVVEDAVKQMSIIYGIYLGEAMLRNYAEEEGFFWGYEQKEAILMKDSSTKLLPITKVYKRLTRDVTENVFSFYNVGKDVANGSFNGKIKPKDE